jgi:coenzyme F420-reducing hydrogenase delta subunit
MVLKICIFYCSNSLSREDLAHYIDKAQGDVFKTIGLPCSGKIDIPYMVKAFETGADGVVVVTCGEGDCQNLEGNMRAQKRSQAVDSLLEEVGLGKGHTTVIQLKDGGAEQIMKEVKTFCTKVRNMSKLNAETSMPQNTNNVVSNQNANMGREKAT